MLIKKYNTETNIKLWQEFLKSKGHNIKVDGNFGKNTKAATEKFQQSQGLKSDGVVGENTLSKALQQGFSGFTQSVETVTPLAKNKKILVSAGHTNKPGFDRGVSANGLIEGQEALIIRDKLSAKLREKGYDVTEDGADGINEPLSKALLLIPGTDLAIEFHFNAGPSTATGIEVLSLPNKKRESQIIAEGVQKALGLNLRGEKGWKSDTSGQHSRLAFCRAGGLVVEVCFLTNRNDVKTYSDNQSLLVSELVEAVENIFRR